MNTSQNKLKTATKDEVTVAKSKDIIAHQPAEIQIFDPQKDVEQAQVAAKALMRVIESGKVLKMQGKTYLFFEHWQTIGQFFHETVGTEWTKPIVEGGKTIGYEAKAVLYNRDGVIIGGAEAACMNDEINWKNKPMFQLRSMAQTRAASKALRNRFGFVAVLAGVEATPAEEMEGTNNEQSRLNPKPAGNSHAPTEKQRALIQKLMKEKGYSREDLFDEGFGAKSYPSEIIKWLLDAKPKQQQEQLPVIEHLTPEEEAAIR
jgi:hypothetical protein